MAKPSSPGGIVAVSHRALSHALNRDPQMTACEVAWLDDGQLERLILACHHLADTAQAERNGREAR